MTELWERGPDAFRGPPVPDAGADSAPEPVRQVTVRLCAYNSPVSGPEYEDAMALGAVLSELEPLRAALLRLAEGWLQDMAADQARPEDG
jgi:hypothetical protein